MQQATSSTLLTNFSNQDGLALSQENSCASKAHILRLHRENYGTWPLECFTGDKGVDKKITKRHFGDFYFATKDDTDVLSGLMVSAMASWWPAYKHSSLIMMLDSSYHGEAQTGVDLDIHGIAKQ